MTAAANAPSKESLLDGYSDDVERLRRHPEFPVQVLNYCISMTVQKHRVPLRKLLNQEFRYVTCYYIIANYARWRLLGGDPPSLSALKQAGRQAASARQIADLVAALRRLKLVTTVCAPGDRRILMLLPSAELIEEIGRHPRLVVGLFERLRKGQALEKTEHDCDWTIKLLLRQAEASDGRHLRDQPFPMIAAFSSRESGYLILLAVFKAYYETVLHQTSISSRQSAAGLSYSALSSAFDVSRSHVADILRAAQAAGWFRIGRGEASLEVATTSVAEFELFVALQAAHFGAISQTI